MRISNKTLKVLKKYFKQLDELIVMGNELLTVKEYGEDQEQLAKDLQALCKLN
jgi:hypothetical protein